jgi:TPR repeat protein
MNRLLILILVLSAFTSSYADDLFESSKAFRAKDYGKAIMHLEKACDQEVFAACDSLAGYYKRGEYVDKDISKSNEYYSNTLNKNLEKCNNGIASGCIQVGSRYYRGKLKGGSKNIELSVEYYNKALALLESKIESGDAKAMSQAAHIYFFQRHIDRNKIEWNKRKEIAKKNHELAMKLYKESCDKNYAYACNSYASRLKKDSLSMPYYEKACNLGDSGGCYNIGVTYLRAENKRSARKYFSKACEMGFIHGCDRLEEL